MLVLSRKVFNERTGIVIGLPMTTAEFNDTNPFAIKFKGPKNVTSYVLGHQPKSFDWRARGAKAHPWKRAPDEVFAAACEQLNQIDGALRSSARRPEGCCLTPAATSSPCSTNVLVPEGRSASSSRRQLP